MNDTQDDGTILPSGRFARMEAALTRIEEKLDLKADAARVSALESIVDALDKHLTDFTTGRVITPTGAEYLKRFNEMEQNIEVLQLSDSNKNAVAQAIKDTADVRYRTLLWLVGIATILNLLFAIGSALLKIVLQH